MTALEAYMICLANRTVCERRDRAPASEDEGLEGCDIAPIGRPSRRRATSPWVRRRWKIGQQRDLLSPPLEKPSNKTLGNGICSPFE